jgi:hypothetical protein
MVGLSVVAISLSTVCPPVAAAAFVCWRADRITKEITQSALRGCPPDERADILRASAELAGNLGMRSSAWCTHTNRASHQDQG